MYSGLKNLVVKEFDRTEVYCNFFCGDI